MKLFLQKNAKFSSMGAPPPDSRASGGWGFCPQTPSLRRLMASPPDPHWPPADGGSAPRPPNQPPIANFWLRACPLPWENLKLAHSEISFLNHLLESYLFLISVGPEKIHIFTWFRGDTPPRETPKYIDSPNLHL